jgi:hypothetical protein
MLGSPRVSPWFTTIPVISQEANPWAEIVTVYEPGIKAVTTNNPAESVLVVRVSPEASFFTMTVAPEMRASVGSVAMPVIVPVNCCAFAKENDKTRIGISSHGIRLSQFGIEVLLKALECAANIFVAS